jgi:hypothetical protein
MQCLHPLVPYFFLHDYVVLYLSQTDPLEHSFFQAANLATAFFQFNLLLETLLPMRVLKILNRRNFKKTWKTTQ